MDSNIILGVKITNATQKEILEFLLKGLQKAGKKLFIVTPNPEILVLANENSQLKGVLNSASLALPDGIGVIWAGKILTKKFKERVTGVDLMEKLCQQTCRNGFTVGFLGGGPKIAERTAECLQRKYPKLEISFVGEEWPLNFQQEKMEKKIDILFVAFGAPKQEIWISNNLEKLPVRLAMGVGGAFDYISGALPRAPQWLQQAGLEWLFRLIAQPWRIKRQLKLVEFIYLVIKEKLSYHKISG